jgi:hypothetical protein
MMQIYVDPGEVTLPFVETGFTGFVYNCGSN